MAAPLAVFRGAASRVATGGEAVTAIYGPVVGGLILNPAIAADQGLPVVEVLYIDLVNPASLGESATTIPLQPGQFYTVPAGITAQVSVNAASSGHRFNAIIWQPQTPFPPTPPPPAPFPPAGPTSLTKVIPSYLYQEYADDDDLQAFVSAFNALAQRYVDWFNQIGLPIYTDLSGTLLDWVGTGLYGLPRPTLSSGRNRFIGPLNTWALNSFPLNKLKIIGPQDVAVTSDDIYKRIITWHFYKGDGKVFNVRWLKRRIMRFLIGVNGTAPNIDQTYQISVSFGTGNQVNITFLAYVRNVIGGALLNRFAINTTPLNSIKTKFTTLPPLPNVNIIEQAINSGVLELPFQFDYVVSVN